MRTPSRWSIVPCVLALSGLLAGCGESDNGFTAPSTNQPPPLTSATVLQPGSAGVGVTTIVFEDTSRPTMANGTFPGAPTRTLTTEVWYPADPGLPEQENRDVPVARAGRRFPLILYSHGFISNRTGGEYLARHLASHGYVVAAPDFPLTNGNAPGAPNAADVVNQPGDLHFLIDQLLAASAAADGLLAGALDPSRIGLTGLSLGGTTTFLATFDSTLRDPRVKAAAPAAGVTCSFGEDFYGDRRVPLLILHGDIDAIVRYQQNAVFAFGEANPPKYLVTIVGGTHTGFADGTEFFDGQNNVDDVGCFGLGSDSSDGPGPLGLFDGAAAGIIAGDCPAPCTDPTPRPHAVTPSRQHALTILSIFPFFEATLRGDSSARHFLETTLVAENPELRIESKH